MITYSLTIILALSVERIVLDLESEAMRGLGSIPTQGNILSLGFFHVVKASDANIAIIAHFVKKPECQN